MLSKRTQIKLTLNVKITAKFGKMLTATVSKGQKSILSNITFIFSVLLKNGMIFVPMDLFFRAKIKLKKVKY